VGSTRDSFPDPTRARISQRPPAPTRLPLQRISIFVAVISHPPSLPSRPTSWRTEMKSGRVRRCAVRKTARPPWSTPMASLGGRRVFAVRWTGCEPIEDGALGRSAYDAEINRRTGSTQLNTKGLPRLRQGIPRCVTRTGNQISASYADRPNQCSAIEDRRLSLLR